MIGVNNKETLHLDYLLKLMRESNLRYNTLHYNTSLKSKSNIHAELQY